MLIAACAKCGEVKKVDLHHKNGNHQDNDPTNRILLCSRCHHLAHIELNIQRTGRPGTKPLSERTFDDPPKLGIAKAKKEYQAFFPRR